jgi:hypothetical protein
VLASLIFVAALVPELPAISRELTWATIEIDDTRGTTELIEVLPQLRDAGESRAITHVLVRKAARFNRRPTRVEWADSRACPGLRPSLDAIAKVAAFSDRTLSSYEWTTLPPPPPTHRPVASLTVGGVSLKAVPGSPAGQWLDEVLEATERCWRADRP